MVGSACVIVVRLRLGGMLTKSKRESEAVTPALAQWAETAEPSYLARCAVLADEQGKDADAALLLAHLSRRDPALFGQAFAKIVTSGTKLRRFVGCIRSGVGGRRSLGARPRAMVRDWLERATDMELLAASVGNGPSLVDIIRMVHPKPGTEARAALYGWLVNPRAQQPALPPLVRDYLAFRAHPIGEPPEVPFDLLISLKLTAAQWATVARRLPFETRLRHLNALVRRKAFADPATLAETVDQVTDPARIAAAGVGPFRLMCLLRSLDPSAPAGLRAALEDALNRAVALIPPFSGAVVVCPNVVGIMTRRATALPRGAATAVRGHDVAALMVTALTQGNRAARLRPYSDGPKTLAPATGGILGLSKQLAVMQGRFSHVGIALEALVPERKPVDLVVIVTANAEGGTYDDIDHGPAMAAAWRRIKAHNRKAKLVCLQIRPDIPWHNPMTLPTGPDILHLSGFSDATLPQIRDFVEGRQAIDYDKAISWVAQT